MDGMISTTEPNASRQLILQSIRAHLVQSAVLQPFEYTPSAGDGDALSESDYNPNGHASAVKTFCERLEEVGGHCIVVREKREAARALKQVISDLQAQSSAADRVALSDAPLLSELTQENGFAELQICPATSDLFGYDIGITTAQAAIAETGTLILESEKERHRLVSLLPPIHLAVLRAGDICLTIGEALDRLSREKERMSRAITFITGPSRTADIELTLTVGVHGPKELYVIIIDEDHER
jgi:L-lactate dehydrogenase complex protein LldG